MSIPFTLFGLIYYFGDDLLNVESIVGTTSLMVAITFHSVFLLVNFWSVNANVFLGYKKVKAGEIEKCSHIKIKLDNRK